MQWIKEGAHDRAVPGSFVLIYMHMLSTLELRGGPEDARAICFMLIALFV